MDQSNLPPAAKLAALIEAGRAANPDLKQGTGEMLCRNKACALGFAAFAIGLGREQMGGPFTPYARLDKAIGDLSGNLTNRVYRANDNGATLDEIILSLREGELAKVEA